MGLDRRGFIHLIVGGAVGTLFTPIPWKFTDDLSIWTQNWPWIPKLKYGAVERTATVSKMCPAGCAVNVRIGPDPGHARDLREAADVILRKLAPGS